MKIMRRDVEAMGWILEQKFMTVHQVERVFWKGRGEKSIEAYRRLLELQRAGYLKRSKSGIYRNVLYLVSARGLRQLKIFGRDRGLSEVFDVDYASYRHDAMVTDLRIMFGEWGFNDWASERVLSLHKNLRRLPDGMIYQQGKQFAIEYESTQKSKQRYGDIFLEYQMERQIEKVLYVVETPGLLEKLSVEASICKKLRFVRFQDLARDQLHATLISAHAQESLHDLLGMEGAMKQ